MALVPAGHIPPGHPLGGLIAALPAARAFLSELRGYYNSRDSWNRLAHEHEQKELLRSAGGQTSHSSSSSMGRRKSRNKGSGGSSRGGRGMTPVNRADLGVRPPTYSIPTTVPRQVSNQVVWDVVKVNTVITTSSSSIVETNFYWSLNSHPSASSWIALYDQWCIPQFSCTFQCAYPEGASTSPGILYTAIDFDNATNLGSIAVLEDYSTCAAALLVAGQNTTRSVRPCVKGALGSANAAAMDRQWVDCAAPSVPWYAIRSIVAICGASYPISVVSTIWFAFRTQI